MNKVLTKLVILSIVFGAIVLILYNNVCATEYNLNGNYEFEGYSMFQYDNIFCVQLGQNIKWRGDNKYRKDKEFEYENNILKINGEPQKMTTDLISYCNGLAYILSTKITGKTNIEAIPPEIQSSKREAKTTANGNEIYVSGDDPRQLALWKYLEGADEFANLLNFQSEKATLENGNSKLEVSGGTIAHVSTSGLSYNPSKEAYELWIKAINNRDLISGNFKIYSLIDIENSNQKLWIVDTNTTTIKSPPVDLIIKKRSSLDNTPIDKVQFKVELKNVKSIKGYHKQQTGKKSTTSVAYVETDGDGNIMLTEIVPEDINKPIEATITEIKVPGHYKKATTPIKITITFNKNTASYSASGTGVTKTSNNIISVSVKNTPLINLSGMVWQDAQTGAKDVSGPNGKRDSYDKYTYVGKGNGQYKAVKNDDGTYKFEDVGQGKGDYAKEENSRITEETGIGEVLVQLYRSNGTLVTTDAYGNKIDNIKTNSNGQYTFNNIEKTNEGYYIKFSYDGINYIATQKDAGNDDTKDSDVSEIDRTAFNNKFKTISKDTESKDIATGIATGTEGETTRLKYNYYKDSDNGNEGNFILNANIDGTNPANQGSPDFRMSAQTGIYKNTTSYIDCGLVKKEFDLAIGTDVKSARLEINDRKVTYDYAKIIDGEMEDLDLDKILDNNSSDNNEVTYNLYLYQSDYNYRISDYKTDTEGGIKNKVNPEDSSKNYEGLKELEAYVTYSIILKGQTNKTATVDEFVYYYDSKYEPTFKVGDTIDGYKVDSINNNKIVLLSNGNDNVIKSDDYRKEVNLEFKVLDLTPGGEFTNVAEITKYSTNEGGLIDKDSAPDNGITVNNNKAEITQYEDDTDKSKGITISLRNDPRTITGTVFEDTDKNRYLNTDKPVNDVIVQLIQIIKYENDPNYYEYIWQETRSGSGTVKKLSSDGNSIEEQDYRTAPNDGSYQFTGYIPGDYIIRYIYGDGTTYDLTDAVKTYNGQDYKSTVDEHYNAPCYNTANYNGQSIARDNEARRLEVMAYSTTIDKEKGKALAEKTTLDKTWMCAETSKINVPIDADDLATEENNTKVSYDNVTNTVSFSNMNFGLALRPKTIISLEKHITGLKITPNGVGVQSIVDANADIEQIIKEDNIKTEGLKQGLATIKSTRGERGFWQVATDVEELAQGAQLEVEYTYVIKNDGEKDYLSNTLVGEYTKNPYNYGTYLASTASSIKNGLKGNTNSYGKYLGKFYYTGDSNGCALVPTRIEANGLEEAINNSLVFDNGDDFAKTNESAVSKTVYDTNGNPTTEDITTVVQSNKESEYLTPNNTDHNKTITLRTVLSSTSGGELGANIPSYIAEITKYSNAAGRRDMLAEPANLSYVHSDDTEMTMANSNQGDEFWGETIIIGKPTGGDKITPIQIAIVTISSIAVLGVGIVLIKKFALKK